jgi:hypothetical protein
MLKSTPVTEQAIAEAIERGMILRSEGLPITRWSRKNEKDVFEHNHIEDGHCAVGTQRPAPKTPEHKSSWGKGQWFFEHLWLSRDIPPKVSHDPL